MAVDVANLAIVAGLVLTGCLVTYYLSRRAFKKACRELRLKNQEELKVLERAIETLQDRIATLKEGESNRITPPTPDQVGNTELASRAPQGKIVPFPAPNRAPVSPDVVVLIAAAVTAFLGKKVSIRSANKLRSPHQIANPWAQQGRIIIQASHNLFSRPRAERFSGKELTL